jgi:5-(carboxyamino)imidazole ribonucleotide synthase
VLKLIQDKGTQKEFYTQNAIPTAPYSLIHSNDLTSINWNDFPGEKVVVKTRTGGYDGKGVAICNKSDLKQGICAFEGPLLLEHFIPNVLELAVIVAVDQQLNAITYPSIEMYFNPVSNLVEFLYSPAQVDAAIEDACRRISQHVVQAFQSPGLFAVELFITPNGEVLVNEIAPRPHNSGHHTIEGCVTSQFAQLNRILLGDTLGSTALKQPSAMINVVGPENVSGTYQLENLDHWNAQPDVFIHMYGKTESRPNRKLGHVTVIANTFEELLKRAEYVKETLRIIPS